MTIVYFKLIVGAMAAQSVGNQAEKRRVPGSTQHERCSGSGG